MRRNMFQLLYIQNEPDKFMKSDYLVLLSFASLIMLVINNYTECDFQSKTSSFYTAFVFLAFPLFCALSVTKNFVDVLRSRDRGEDLPIIRRKGDDDEYFADKIK